MPASDLVIQPHGSQEIARALGLEHRGPDRRIHRVDTPSAAGEHSLVFLGAAEALSPTTDCIAIVRPDWNAVDVRGGMALILAKEPRLAFARALALLAPLPISGVSSAAAVESGANVHPSARIDAFAVIEAGAVIGSGSVIRSHAVVRAGVRVGANCEIGEHTVLGNDGLTVPIGEDGVPVPMRHVGGLRIGDGTRIGPHCTIGRGTLDDARIGRGCVIGPLVNVGHNGGIDDHCIVTGGTTLAGGVRVGRGAWIGVAAVVHHKVEIGAKATIGGGAVVTRDVLPGQTVVAWAARALREVAEDRRLKRS